jgi:hypothetical protein
VTRDPIRNSRTPADPTASTSPPGRRLLIAVAAALAIPAAHAQVAAPTDAVGPYGGISQSIGHDSNVFRVRDSDRKTPDVFFVTSLLAGINAPVGRQRLYADAAVRFTKFQDVNQLDSEGYNLNAGIDWETAGRLSGNVGIVARQSLAEFGVGGAAGSTELNLERAQELRGSVVWGAQQTLGAELAGSTSNLDYSNRLAASQRLQQSSLSAGVRYRPSAQLRLGLGVRQTDGKYPDFFTAGPSSFAPLEFDRQDVDLTAAWVPTGFSSLDARLSSTRQDYTQDPARDFSGVTGELAWTYVPTGRLTFRTSILRDTGSGATFQQLGTAGSTTVGESSGVATGLRLNVTYAVTGKINAELGLASTQRDFGGAVGGSETLNQYTLGAQWAYSRAMSFGCRYTGETRSASSALSYDYSSGVALCFGQFVVR